MKFLLEQQLAVCLLLVQCPVGTATWSPKIQIAGHNQGRYRQVIQLSESKMQTPTPDVERDRRVHHDLAASKVNQSSSSSSTATPSQGGHPSVAPAACLYYATSGIMRFRKGKDIGGISGRPWKASSSRYGYWRYQSWFRKQEALDSIIRRKMMSAQFAVANPLNTLGAVSGMWRPSRAKHSTAEVASKSCPHHSWSCDEQDTAEQRFRFSVNMRDISALTPACRTPMLQWVAEYGKYFLFGFGKLSSPLGARCMFQSQVPQEKPQKMMLQELAEEHRRILDKILLTYGHLDTNVTSSGMSFGNARARSSARSADSFGISVSSPTNVLRRGAFWRIRYSTSPTRPQARDRRAVIAIPNVTMVRTFIDDVVNMHLAMKGAERSPPVAAEPPAASAKVHETVHPFFISSKRSSVGQSSQWTNAATLVLFLVTLVLKLQFEMSRSDKQSQDPEEDFTKQSCGAALPERTEAAEAEHDANNSAEATLDEAVQDPHEEVADNNAPQAAAQPGMIEAKDVDATVLEDSPAEVDTTDAATQNDVSGDSSVGDAGVRIHPDDAPDEAAKSEETSTQVLEARRTEGSEDAEATDVHEENDQDDEWLVVEHPEVQILSDLDLQVDEGTDSGTCEEITN